MGTEKIARLFTDPKARRSIFRYFDRRTAQALPRTLGAHVSIRYAAAIPGMEKLRGTINSVTQFPDGWLLGLEPEPGTPFTRWGSPILLWISNQPQGSGILDTSTSLREKRLGYR